MIDPNKYAEFVDAVTSQESKDPEAFTARVADLYHSNFPTERLLTLSLIHI